MEEEQNAEEVSRENLYVTVQQLAQTQVDDDSGNARRLFHAMVGLILAPETPEEVLDLYDQPPPDKPVQADVKYYRFTPTSRNETRTDQMAIDASIADMRGCLDDLKRRMDFCGLDEGVSDRAFVDGVDIEFADNQRDYPEGDERRWEANLQLVEPMKTYQRMRERLEGCIQLVTLSLHDFHVHRNDHLGAEDAFRYNPVEHNTGEMVITREAQNALYLKNLQISGEEIHCLQTMKAEEPVKNVLGQYLCKVCHKPQDQHGTGLRDHAFVFTMTPQTTVDGQETAVSQMSYGPCRNPDSSEKTIEDFIYESFRTPNKFDRYLNASTVERATKNMLSDKFNPVGKRVIRTNVLFTCQNGIVHIEQYAGSWVPTFTPFPQYCACHTLPRSVRTFFPCRCAHVHERLRSKVVQKSFPHIHIPYEEWLRTLLGAPLHDDTSDEEWGEWYNGGGRQPFEHLTRYRIPTVVDGHYVCRTCEDTMRACTCEGGFSPRMEAGCVHCGQVQRSCECDEEFCPFKLDRHKAAMSCLGTKTLWTKKIFVDQGIDPDTMLFWASLWFGRSQFKVNTHDHWSIALNIYGRAETGKGVLGDLLKELFEKSSKDLLVITTSDQEKFAGGNMFHADGSMARIGLCLDSNPDRMVDRATFCSMTAGEAVTVPVKGEKVIRCPEYITNLAYCSNPPIYQHNDHSGSLNRRVVYLRFTKGIQRNDNLVSAAKQEILYVLMASLLEYFHHTDPETHNGRTFWQFCPEYFKAQRRHVRFDVDPVARFLLNEIDKGDANCGMIFHPDASMPWREFAKGVTDYVKTLENETLRHFNSRSSTDAEETLSKMGITVENGQVYGITPRRMDDDDLPSTPPNIYGDTSSAPTRPNKRARSNDDGDARRDMTPADILSAFRQTRDHFSQREVEELRAMLAQMEDPYGGGYG